MICASVALPFAWIGDACSALADIEEVASYALVGALAIVLCSAMFAIHVRIDAKSAASDLVLFRAFRGALSIDARFVKFAHNPGVVSVALMHGSAVAGI